MVPSMTDRGETVTVKLVDYDRLREELREAQNDVHKLRVEVNAAKLGDLSGTTKMLHDAFHETIKVVQFAVGNLDPQTIAGWPHKALVAIAAAIETIPGIDQHVAEMPGELRSFARSAAGHEERRRRHREANPSVPASAEDFGPQTEEARRVHEATVQQVKNGDGATST